MPYEDQLARDAGYAMNEGGRHFEGTSKVHLALRRIAQRLSELKIPYAVADGMALFSHGLRRFTEDVDILVTAEGLRLIHERLDGLGYIRPFERSKNLRDSEHGVRIEFLIAGQFPGDGKPKPVAFPDPADVAEDRDGIQFVNLSTLIELKLASGISSPERMKDLSDVQELIKLLNLERDIGAALSEYVRKKYDELWLATRQIKKRYVLLWRNKWLTAEAKTIDEMIAGLHRAAELLSNMKRDGVAFEPQGGTANDYAYLTTTDPDIARKYGMSEENELWDDGGDASEE
ncbi:MAG: hypothetical protein WD894_16535 [Pirellulales bacterium]